MGKFIDEKGNVYGKLKVVNYSNIESKWLCHCECGKLTLVSGSDLRKGSVISCGCARGYNNLKDLTGKTFGKLTCIKYKKSKSKWLCTCSCGKEIYVKTEHLTSGVTKSCGCLKDEKMVGKGITKEPHYKRLYNIWSFMKKRCEDSTRHNYKWYGGKGIKVCDEWKDMKNFYNWAINNGYQEGLQIDRIDSDKDYCPENCRWLTKSENVSRMATAKQIEKLNTLSTEDVVKDYVERKIEDGVEKKKQFFFRKPNYCVLKNTDSSKQFLFKSYKKIAYFLNISYSSLSYRIRKKDGMVGDNWKVEKINKELFNEIRNKGVEVIN